MDVSSVFRRPWQYLRALSVNVYFWGGIGVLAAVGLLVYLVFNAWIMPSYTRYEVSVLVPDVSEYTYEQAAQMLLSNNLNVEREVQRFNPDLPRDVVVDQNPNAGASVKPGRRVYLTVNSGTTPTVRVPRVDGFSLREAQNRMISAGLKVGETRPDSIPSPHRNTVTRQRPGAGTSLPLGSNVTLWYSTGLGEQYVLVPDVSGMRVDEARRVLLGQRLRSVVIGGRGAEEIVNKQSPEAGTQVREGHEVRLYVE